MAIQRLDTTKSTKKKMCASEIAEGPFRSLQEVETYLKTLKDSLSEMEGLLRQYQLQFARSSATATPSLEFVINGDRPAGGRKGVKVNLDKIDKIVMPRLDTLRKNFGIAEQLGSQLNELDVLYNNVAVTFRGVRGSNDMLDKIKAMKGATKSKLDAALKFLSTVGERHTPNNFREIVETTIGFVTPGLTFVSYKTHLYAYETKALDKKEGDLAFAIYIQLNGLEDEEGHIYPQFFVVFNCVLHSTDEKNKVEPRFYVTVMHQFSTPGSYGLGKAFTTPGEAARALGMLLDLENINTAIGTVPHNLDPGKLPKSRFSEASYISKINVEPNALIFELLKGVKSAQVSDIAKNLYKDVKGLLSHIKDAKIKVKLGKSEDGRTTIRYTLTNVAKDTGVSAEDLDFLKERFELDDAKLRQVVKVLNQD